MFRTKLAAVAAALALGAAGLAVWLTAGGGAAPAQAAWKMTSKGFSLHAQGCGDATLPSFRLRGNGNFLFWAPKLVGGGKAAHSVTLRRRSGGDLQRIGARSGTSYAGLRGGAYALDVHADGCWRVDVQGDVHAQAAR